MRKYFVPFFLDRTIIKYEDAFITTQYSGTHFTLVDSGERFENKELANKYVSKMCSRKESEAVFIILEIYVS